MLYLWLSGHWFGRVMAMVFWVPTIVIGPGHMIPNVNLPPTYGAIYGLTMLTACCILAWLISSLPIYLRAWRRPAGSRVALAVRDKLDQLT